MFCDATITALATTANPTVQLAQLGHRSLVSARAYPKAATHKPLKAAAYRGANAIRSSIPARPPRPHLGQRAHHPGKNLGFAGSKSNPRANRAGAQSQEFVWNLAEKRGP